MLNEASCPSQNLFPSPVWSPRPCSGLTGGGASERGGASLPGFQSQRELLSSGQPLTAGGTSSPLLPLLPLMMIVSVCFCFTKFASSQEMEGTAGCPSPHPPQPPSPLPTSKDSHLWLPPLPPAGRRHCLLLAVRPTYLRYLRTKRLLLLSCACSQPEAPLGSLPPSRWCSGLNWT